MPSKCLSKGNEKWVCHLAFFAMVFKDVKRHESEGVQKMSSTDIWGAGALRFFAHENNALPFELPLGQWVTSRR